MIQLQYIDKIKVITHTIAISKSDCHMFGLRKLKFPSFFLIIKWCHHGFILKEREKCLDFLLVKFSVVSVSKKKKKYCRLLKCLNMKINSVWFFFIILIFFTAKDLIRGLLKTVPEERLSIEDVMRNKWVAVSHLFCYF